MLHINLFPKIKEFNSSVWVLFPSQGQGPPPPSLLAQAHGGAAGLGLYPILWQYPNGTPTPYPPGLNLPPTAKWVHPENHVSVNSEVSLRRVGLYFDLFVPSCCVLVPNCAAFFPFLMNALALGHQPLSKFTYLSLANINGYVKWLRGSLLCFYLRYLRCEFNIGVWLVHHGDFQG